MKLEAPKKNTEEGAAPEADTELFERVLRELEIYEESEVTRAASAARQDAAPATADATVVARLRAAGAALTLAFSYTQWYNASEAEVYGYSILFTCLGLWLIVYWEGTGHGQQNDRWLFAISYIFGLGGGLHL